MARLLHGKSVIGWNIDFDVRMLHQTCGKYGMELPVCHTEDMLAFYRQLRQRPQNRLAIRDEGLTISGDLHRAETDCGACDSPESRAIARPYRIRETSLPVYVINLGRHSDC